MSNPVLVELTRGEHVESVHAVSVAVADDKGQLVLRRGDLEPGVFARSAVKAIQALPLIEDGSADHLGLTDAEIALAVASHSGEPAHVELAAAMLARCDRTESCLECGAHWPMGAEAAYALARSGAAPGQLHNNCSGKHASFVCDACTRGEDPVGYVDPDHPVQQRIRRALEEVTGHSLSSQSPGTDGCSIPAFAIPLPALALGFARLATGTDLPDGRREASARIRKAAAAHPFLVAGTGRFDTVVMTLLRERAFVKIGAEGVYCAALPELGLGVALKSADGAARSAEVVMAGVLHEILPMDGTILSEISALANPILRNWRDTVTGGLRLAGPVWG